jgi:hypothetical protein
MEKVKYLNTNSKIKKLKKKTKILFVFLKEDWNHIIQSQKLENKT